MKIPKDAKKVFTGKIYDVYHWEQEMLDGSFQTFEVLWRPDSAIVLATKNGKLLIAKETQPRNGTFWGFFGGRIEKNETALEAAKRELEEETGMSSNNWSELFKYEMPHSDWTLNYFIAKDCELTTKPKADIGEHIEIHEIDFKDLPKYMNKKNWREQLIKVAFLSELDKDKLTNLKKSLEL